MTDRNGNGLSPKPCHLPGFNRVNLLGVEVDACTREGAVEYIASLITRGGSHQIVTANAEIIWRAWQDPALACLLDKSDLVTADGSGVVWAAKRLSSGVPEKVSGIDLVRDMAARGARDGWRFFLYGGAPGVAEEAASRLARDNPGLKVIGTAHGYQNEAADRRLIKKIHDLAPDVLLVALGAPRQEFWIARHRDDLHAAVSMGVGGSFDVLAGKVKRAPSWICSMNLEWLYRLVKEPRRWRRQLALPAFAWRVLRESMPV